MVQNLKVTHYLNGDPIPNVTDLAVWGNLTTGAYCWYYNDLKLGMIYGGLYNWYTIGDPRGIGIKGWHVPSDYEFNELITFLGGEISAYPKVLEASLDHWFITSVTVTNSSGFTALPNGCIDLHPINSNPENMFSGLGFEVTFWTTFTIGIASTAAETVRNAYFSATTGYSVKCGYGIRLIKDTK